MRLWRCFKTSQASERILTINYVHSDSVPGDSPYLYRHIWRHDSDDRSAPVESDAEEHAGERSYRVYAVLETHRVRHHGFLLAGSHLDKYYPNPCFQLKLCLLTLAGVHGLIFHRSVYYNASLDQTAQECRDRRRDVSGSPAEHSELWTLDRLLRCPGRCYVTAE